MHDLGYTVIPNYRFYAPGLGRWTKRDDIGEHGGYNLYEMVRNEPIGLIDFLGREKSIRAVPVKDGKEVKKGQTWKDGTIVLDTKWSKRKLKSKGKGTLYSSKLVKSEVTSIWLGTDKSKPGDCFIVFEDEYEDTYFRLDKYVEYFFALIYQVVPADYDRRYDYWYALQKTAFGRARSAAESQTNQEYETKGKGGKHNVGISIADIISNISDMDKTYHGKLKEDVDWIYYWQSYEYFSYTSVYYPKKRHNIVSDIQSLCYEDCMLFNDSWSHE